MFYAHNWWYRTASKSLPEASLTEADLTEADLPRADPSGLADQEREGSFTEGAAVIFVHAEAGDEDRRKGVVQKFLKNTKWIAGKFTTRKIVLHSFSHLGSSKASPAFALGVMDEVAARLEDSGYTVMRTPFGYFNEFRIHVAGDSLAKVFKEF